MSINCFLLRVWSIYPQKRPAVHGPLNSARNQQTMSRSGSGYISLFITPNQSRANGLSNKPWNFLNPQSDFARRFGVGRLYERNFNLLKTLKDPSGALEQVNDAILKVSDKLTGEYQEFLNEFRDLGFGDDEAIARADVMIGRRLESELSMLQIKYPYATGGAEAGGWDPITAILQQNEKARALPRTFQAVQSSGGLGVKAGQGVSTKQRLKRKFKRRYRK